MLDLHCFARCGRLLFSGLPDHPGNPRYPRRSEVQPRPGGPPEHHVLQHGVPQVHLGYCAGHALVPCWYVSSAASPRHKLTTILTAYIALIFPHLITDFMSAAGIKVSFNARIFTAACSALLGTYYTLAYEFNLIMIDRLGERVGVLQRL